MFIPPKNSIHLNHFSVEEGPFELLFLWVEATSWLLAIHCLPLHVIISGLYGMWVMLIGSPSPLRMILLLDVDEDVYDIFPSRITIDVEPFCIINI